MHSSAKLLFRHYGIYSQQKLPKKTFSTTFALERKAPFSTLWDLFPTITSEKEIFDYSCTRAQSSFFDTIFIPNKNFRKRIFDYLCTRAQSSFFDTMGFIPNKNFRKRIFDYLCTRAQSSFFDTMGFIPNKNFRKRIFRLLLHSSAKLLFRHYGIYSQQKLPKKNFSTTFALERKAPFSTLWDLFPTKTSEKEFFD